MRIVGEMCPRLTSARTPLAYHCHRRTFERPARAHRPMERRWDSGVAIEEAGGNAYSLEKGLRPGSANDIPLWLGNLHANFPNDKASRRFLASSAGAEIFRKFPTNIRH